MRLIVILILALTACGPTVNDVKNRLADEALMPQCASESPLRFDYGSTSPSGDYLDTIWIDVDEHCRSDWLARFQADDRSTCDEYRCEKTFEHPDKRVYAYFSERKPELRLEFDQW